MPSFIRFLITFSLLLFPVPVFAIYDPLSVPNNKYGIHILNQEDIYPAAALVNSQGGQWGYVTLVIREDDRDPKKWQSIFDELRRRRLIPIVRLATRFQDNHWIKPRSQDIQPWITFLSNLNWVIENRYVVIFNEPNQASEWGGSINPQEYVQTLRAFHHHLKQASPDFFILPAALDLGPETTPTTLHPYDFLSAMYQSDPQVFNLIDGWTSHSYPNPDFSAPATNSGRTSILGFRWELQTLKKLGVSRLLPIFLTETGWAHNQGRFPETNRLSPTQVNQNFLTAFKHVWTDPNIVAITPFILNYQHPPFDKFSWQIIESSTYHPVYASTQLLPKTSGQPLQHQSSLLLKKYFPSQLIVNSQYLIAFYFKNIGQTIWDPAQITLKYSTNLPSGSISVDPFSTTEPFQTAKGWLHINTPNDIGQFTLTLQLQDGNLPFGDQIEYQFQILPNTPITHLKLWLQQLLHFSDFTF